MSVSNLRTPDARPEPTGLNWIEFGFFCAVLIAGFLFLHDATHWGQAAYVGSAQFGDAEFWWNGALHFAQGIVAENPNLTYRMGYAVFAGLIAAVLGPDYPLFHSILVGIFLLTGCGLYLSLRALAGRWAAAAAVLLLVFNPYTAEWLAISTSDALGLILNLIALLAIIAATRREIRLRWVALFGFALACASLTRPLMTPFIVPAALVVVVAAWGAWRKATVALVILLASFIAPTVAWMSVMAATTGNFALTGESQDSSAFYAASDPQIQVWRPDMYEKVRESAKAHNQTDQPTARQLNEEFWQLTRTNYQQHWRFHLERLWTNAFELARFQPSRATTYTPGAGYWRIGCIAALGLILCAGALIHRRWLNAAAIAGTGALWLFWSVSFPWLVIHAMAFGLLALFLGRRDGFLWAAYWCVGAMALYLTGGTWGPPLGPTQELNALGYRLGFQFLFVGDVLVVALLGAIAVGTRTSAPGQRRFTLRPDARAEKIARFSGLTALLALGIVLGLGAAIVTYRLYARSNTEPVAHPPLSLAQSSAAALNTTALTDITALRVALNTQDGERLITFGMSSGFIWNLPGQDRSMLLLYQQDWVRPVTMSPRQVLVEVPRHLPDEAWMNRQGAWVLRSFPNTAQTSNLPYYFEMPAVQAYIPLTADRQAFDLGQVTVFPLAKSATQLVAGGELTFQGASPDWAVNSGSLKFPRRFALRATAEDQTLRLEVALQNTRGHRSLRFGAIVQSGAPHRPRLTPVHLHLGGIGDAKPTMWESDLVADAPEPLWVSETPADQASAVVLTAYHLNPGDTLWLYELVLTADDFTQ